MIIWTAKDLAQLEFSNKEIDAEFEQKDKELQAKRHDYYLKNKERLTFTTAVYRYVNGEKRAEHMRKYRAKLKETNPENTRDEAMSLREMPSAVQALIRTSPDDNSYYSLLRAATTHELRLAISFCSLYPSKKSKHVKLIKKAIGG